MLSLNTSRLIKKPVQVRGENGKVHTRMQWVKPGEDTPTPNQSGKSEVEDKDKFMAKLDAKFGTISNEAGQGVLPRASGSDSPTPRTLPPTKKEKVKLMVENRKPAQDKRSTKEITDLQGEELDKLKSRMSTGNDSVSEWGRSFHNPSEHKISEDEFRKRVEHVFGEDITKEGIEKALSHPDDEYSVSFSTGNGIELFDFSEFNPFLDEEDYEDELFDISDMSQSEFDETMAETGMVSENALMLNMDIKDTNGKIVGTLMRGVDRDEKDGSFVVYNELFRLDAHAQGKGIADTLYKRSEALWKELSKTGDVKVSVHANISVGVYAWATKGFDFKQESESKKAVKELSEFITNNGMNVDKVLQDCGVSKIEDLKTAKDFADLDDGYDYDLSTLGLKGHGHLGKAFMLGGKRSWDGVRKISKSSVSKSLKNGTKIESDNSSRQQKELTWTREKEENGREGLINNPDGSTSRDDMWLHSELNLEKAPLEKSRKSTGRLDRKPKKPKAVQDSHSRMLSELGLENFKDDVLTHRVVSKSELYIDLSKADNKHLPKGSERHSYKTKSNYDVLYIPVNRLKQVYQTDEAINPRKVNENVRKMKENIPLEPVEIGYSYDVHDGHHRWEAAKKLGYTHVPCKVVGQDPKKLKQAKEEYGKIWKSFELDEQTKKDLQRLSIDQFVKDLLSSDITKSDKEKNKKEDKDKDTTIPPDEVISHYVDTEKGINPVEDEEKWKKDVYKRDKKFREDLGVSKSLTGLYIDLEKSALNTAKLVKKHVTVRGKNGKTHSRMQWVKPGEDTPDMKSAKGDHSTFHHHEDGIKDLEKRQSNKFPIVHHNTNELKNMDHNYTTDKSALADAEKKYNAGEKLPPVKINPRGEILENAHLVDMAKKHGISHIPVIVVGNPTQKKELETKLKRMHEGEDHKEAPKENEETGKLDNTSSEMVGDLDHFLNFTKKKYTKQHLMKEAEKQGISFKKTMNDGRALPENSSILWMHAHKAIVSHIKSGKTFEVNHVEKDVDERMKVDGKDTIQKHFLKLLEKHGSKDALMKWAKESDIHWNEKIDPSINWMNCVKAVKKELAKGKMVDGVRTRQKGVMADANAVVTTQIKEMVGAYGKKYGKANVMTKADSLGIQFNRFSKKGDQLPDNSSILWMRAHEAISHHIAKGGEFKMAGDNGITANTGDYGDADMSTHQAIAVDVGKRNSQMKESDAKDWSIKAMMVDGNLSQEDAEQQYSEFMKKAREKRVMVHFDPLELLPSGTTLLDQISSDGHFKNDYELGRGVDAEHRETNERDLFGDEFDEASSSERPTYGVIDLFNKGLKSHSYNGEVAFVLKDSTKKRTTGSSIDSNNIPYGEEGQHVRSMEDPHHLVVDRWQSKWKKINKADPQRARMFDSVLNGTPNGDDNDFFETHIHGGVKMDRDVDHILVPKEWRSDTSHKDKHDNIKNFAGQFGLTINYD